MKIVRLFLTLATVPFLFAACTSDSTTNAPLGSYDNGVLVLNEGGLGEVTYISNDFQTVQNDVFATVNGEVENLGSFAQSMFFDGDRAYIISNGSNKITVVNRYSFEYIATIATGMQVPRYGVVYNGKAYVTNMNDYSTSADDFITVINLADFSVETPIAVTTIAERIVAYDGKLYVSGGAYGMGDKITVVNISTKTIENTITVGTSPNSLEEKDGILYVLCGSFAAESKLVKINLSTDTIIDEVAFPAIANAQNLDVEGNSLYFSSGAKVYKVATDAESISDVPLFTVPSTSAYIGYGFGVSGDRIFISEAADDFVSFGKAFVYSTSGNFLDQFETGLGPNGFYFN